MRLYGPPASRTRRCLWALEESGAEFELCVLQLGKGEHRTSAYLAINPNGKVPALVDGDVTLFESGAICNYIGTKFPGAGLTPTAGTDARAEYDQWMFFVCSELEQPLWSLGKHRFVFPPERRIAAMESCAQWEWTVAAKVLAGALDGRTFIAGDSFTCADILVAHTLSWARGFGVDLGHDVLDRYADRMLARPAYKRTLDPDRYPAIALA